MNNLLLFDIGMYDGADTEYYLDKGFRVIAVDANPTLVDVARERFTRYLESGQLILENLAIGESEGMAELHLSRQDLGASSTRQERILDQDANGTVLVHRVPFAQLLRQYGTPYYLKVDIEGDDRYCILELSKDQRPSYVSFEMGKDADELLDHLVSIGYTYFKIISQLSFLEISNDYSFSHRIRRKVTRFFRGPDSEYVSRDGFQFKRGHSSGPMAGATDGKWQSISVTRAIWGKYGNRQRGGWFDLHACSV